MCSADLLVCLFVTLSVCQSINFLILFGPLSHYSTGWFTRLSLDDEVYRLFKSKTVKEDATPHRLDRI